MQAYGIWITNIYINLAFNYWNFNQSASELYINYEHVQKSFWNTLKISLSSGDNVSSISTIILHTENSMVTCLLSHTIGSYSLPNLRFPKHKHCCSAKALHWSWLKGKAKSNIFFKSYTLLSQFNEKVTKLSKIFITIPVEVTGKMGTKVGTGSNRIQKVFSS